MKKIILKFTDTNVYFFNSQKNKLIKSKLIKNIVKDSKIIDIELFIQELDNLLKRNKLTTILLKTKLYIIIPSFYNNTDIFLLDYTFKNLNYYNYKLIKENQIYENMLTNTNAIISLWNNQGEISYKIKNKIISECINLDDINKINVENIIVINNTINKQLSLENKNVIYLEPQTYYIITKLNELIMSNQM